VPARIEQLSRLSDEQADAVLALRDAIAARDGSSPLPDHVVLRLREPSDGEQHLLGWAGDELRTYAHLSADRQAELAIAPGADPGPILDALARSAGPSLRVWARGAGSPVAAELAARGYVVVRELLQMRRPMSLPLDPPAWPAGVTVRTFVVGQDERGWLEINNRAFAGHPDQSGWTVADITAREREPWFDPAGFFLAERDASLVGFHWTKVHQRRGGDEPLGEIYVIGVDPAMQGQRLGEALARHGLRHLSDAGMATVTLYVEAANRGAISLYERLGFSRFDADRCLALP
jgi:mycothiol synthase